MALEARALDRYHLSVIAAKLAEQRPRLQQLGCQRGRAWVSRTVGDPLALPAHEQAAPTEQWQPQLGDLGEGPYGPDGNHIPRRAPFAGRQLLARAPR